MARILYYTTYDRGLGADRWIVQGYKDAFLSLGHEFFTTESERYAINKRLKEVQPDIFIAPAGDLARKRRQVLEILGDPCVRGTKTFFFVDTYFNDYLGFIHELESRRLPDFYFGYYAAEIMLGFEKVVGRPYNIIPLAANHKLHFPVKPDPRYGTDISFIGNRLPTKEAVFKKLLFPLLKKYRVRIYGPGWTIKDKALRAISGLGRKSRIFGLADWANRKRITVSPEDERKVYSSSKICLNIHEYYHDGRCKNFSNEREFKIPACGGFQISDSVIGIERFFIPGEEIVIAENAEDWFRKIDFYMRNSEARKQVQESGTRRALRDHTYTHRARMILKLCGI